MLHEIIIDDLGSDIWIGYTVLIPAYKPNEKFVELVSELKEKGIDILAVDDGSGPEYKVLFDKAAKHRRNDTAA